MTSTTTSPRTRLTKAEWTAEGKRRFGENPTAWRFVCPCCGHVATPDDWYAAKAPEGAIAFSCVGRWSGAKREAFGAGAGPCNYAGGGLFPLNPVTVVDEDGKEHAVFDFAPAPSSSTIVPSVPLCADCLAAVHAASEPDFPHHRAAAGETCGAADHDDNVVDADPLADHDEEGA